MKYKNKTIVHTCSSILVRPNGIVRYMNAVMNLQRKQGHTVIFITDAQPTQTIDANRIIYENETSSYVPNWQAGHVWLQIDQTISQLINTATKKLTQTPDLIVAHDLHSYLGVVDLFPDGIFVQHESDVINTGSRYSFLSDEYLQKQQEIANTTNWRTGLPVMRSDIRPLRPVYTPPPVDVVANPAQNKTQGLLYIGDATERKGAREFMDLARTLNIKPTVITHEVDNELFAGACVHSFKLDQRDAMYELMSQHRVAYIPSKNECFSLAVIECLQFMPVVVNGDNKWTQNLDDLGVIRTQNTDLVKIIKQLLEEPHDHNRCLLDLWAKHSHQFWINLSM